MEDYNKYGWWFRICGCTRRAVRDHAMDVVLLLYPGLMLDLQALMAFTFGLKVPRIS